MDIQDSEDCPGREHSQTEILDSTIPGFGDTRNCNVSLIETRRLIHFSSSNYGREKGGTLDRVGRRVTMQ